MAECICNSCKNLKSVKDESKPNQSNISETCEFGFPSDDCYDCQVDDCELTCDNYIGDSEETVTVTARCAKCDKELQLQSNNSDDGDVYCVTCYLNN